MVDQYNKYPVDGGNQGQTHVSPVSIGSQDVEDSIRVPLKFMEVISAGWIGQIYAIFPDAEFLWSTSKF